jgi:hypothetical protein
MTRLGTLAVYSTPSSACSPSSWPRFHHDNANSGDDRRDAIPPGKPYGVSLSGTTLSFKAPGDDLLCGTADHYQLVQSDGPITEERFASLDPVPVIAPAPAPAGTTQTITLPGGVKANIGIRAVDKQGNIGPVAAISTGGGGATGSGASGGTNRRVASRCSTRRHAKRKRKHRRHRARARAKSGHATQARRRRAHKRHKPRHKRSCVRPNKKHKHKRRHHRASSHRGR